MRQNSQRIRLIGKGNALPEALRDLVEGYWAAYQETVREAGLEPLSHGELRQLLFRVWAGSDFVARQTIDHPEVFHDLMGSGDLFRDYLPPEYHERVKAAVAAATDETDLMVSLRLLRQREMLRIAWRDLAGWAPLSETLVSLSTLADACVKHPLDRLHAWLSKELGKPTGAHSKKPQRLVVLGMGKLGAHELNFSSDIDLILAFEEDGETRGGPMQASNEEFFTRLSRKLIQALDTRDVNGMVFRVDTRLRPYGDSGPLVMNFDAIEHYYQTHGRDWERYAMIKARPLTGGRAADVLMKMLRPFVYRRYLDFGAFEALRDMKELITQQVRRKGMENNVKLGPGGIREVEFIGQVFQMIRGGREPALRIRGILDVLEMLAEMNLLPRYVAEELIEGYCFLRQVENRLQAFEDKQTHLLPAGDLERVRLALSMGFSTWDAFHKQLRKTMETIHEHFEQVFTAPQTHHVQTADGVDLTAVWRGALEREQAEAFLQRSGFTHDATAVLDLLHELRDSTNYRALTKQGTERMDQLIPLLLGAVAAADDAAGTLRRVLDIIETVARRTAYLALLVEHPMALSQLVKLCEASPWISSYVALHPLLLDELLDPRTLYEPLDRDTLQHELAGRMGEVEAEDLEQQMETLRHFAQSNILRVAAADISDVMPLMEVSDHLTAIAEVVLDVTLDRAWHYLSHRHGVPLCKTGKDFWAPGFAIIGYGKLGGIELGYGSDLDLVFIHNSDGEQEVTAGPKRIDNNVFFARLGQRIIHMLSARTPSGVLYEVDTRLRPRGASGMLVTNLATFAEYQESDAWTWEHQALVRARFIAGDPGIGEQFAAVRAAILSKPRDAATLQQEVREMRERMRRELAPREADVFDLKHSPGGIADIEFIVQYCVLRWAPAYPELIRWTDNIRLLETLGKGGLMVGADVTSLSDAYRQYRAAGHRLTLQQQPTRVAAEAFQAQRQAVSRIWNALMEQDEAAGDSVIAAPVPENSVTD
jgi:glutamate-ammonia-ligase adenylyltransferase